MKNFNLKSLFILGFALFAFAGCETEYIERIEMRLEGIWYFDNVRYSKNLSFDNITNDYDEDLIEFFDDNSVIYTFENGDEMEGIYQFNLVSGGETSIGQLVMSFIDNQTGEQMLYLWDNCTITNRRITAQEEFDNGQFHFRMKRY